MSVIVTGAAFCVGVLIALVWLCREVERRSDPAPSMFYIGPTPPEERGLAPQNGDIWLDQVSGTLLVWNYCEWVEPTPLPRR